MNDPQYVEAYRAIAEAALASGDDGDLRLTYLYRLATRKRPSAAMLELLRGYYALELNGFRADGEKVAARLAAGVTLEGSEFPAAAVAAMTSVVGAVMNSPDAYTVR
jgi:hypothetical protein